MSFYQKLLFSGSQFDKTGSLRVQPIFNQGFLRIKLIRVYFSYLLILRFFLSKFLKDSLVLLNSFKLILDLILSLLF